MIWRSWFAGRRQHWLHSYIFPRMFDLRSESPSWNEYYHHWRDTLTVMENFVGIHINSAASVFCRRANPRSFPFRRFVQFLSTRQSAFLLRYKRGSRSARMIFNGIPPLHLYQDTIHVRPILQYSVKISQFLPLLEITFMLLRATSVALVPNRSSNFCT